MRVARNAITAEAASASRVPAASAPDSAPRPRRLRTLCAIARTSAASTPSRSVTTNASNMEVRGLDPETAERSHGTRHRAGWGGGRQGPHRARNAALRHGTTLTVRAVWGNTRWTPGHGTHADSTLH